MTRTPPAGRRVSIAGKDLTCVVCGVGQEFLRRDVKMNTEGLTFLNLDFLNESADGAICTACGYVHLFMSDAHTWAPPA